MGDMVVQCINKLIIR